MIGLHTQVLLARIIYYRGLFKQTADFLCVKMFHRMSAFRLFYGVLFILSSFPFIFVKSEVHFR